MGFSGNVLVAAFSIVAYDPQEEERGVLEGRWN